jgi:hypothetical protein
MQGDLHFSFIHCLRMSENRNVNPLLEIVTQSRRNEQLVPIENSFVTEEFSVEYTIYQFQGLRLNIIAYHVRMDV